MNEHHSDTNCTCIHSIDDPVHPRNVNVYSQIQIQIQKKTIQIVIQAHTAQLERLVLVCHLIRHIFDGYCHRPNRRWSWHVIIECRFREQDQGCSTMDAALFT